MRVDESRPRSAPAVGEPRSSAVAAAGLHEACMAAARHYERAAATASAIPDAAVVTLERAVRAYVDLCKRDRLPPERALVCVKDVMRACAPAIRHTRSELLLREVVFTAFLAAYFPEGRRRSDARGGMLSPAQWATLSEAR